MELKVWVEGIQRIVCGVNEKTTCQDVVFALAHATGKTGRFTLIERWRNSERLLAPSEQPLKVLLKWGEHSNDVQFILQWSPLDATATTNKSGQLQQLPSSIKTVQDGSCGSENSSSHSPSPLLKPNYLHHFHQNYSGSPSGSGGSSLPSPLSPPNNNGSINKKTSNLSSFYPSRSPTHNSHHNGSANGSSETHFQGGGIADYNLTSNLSMEGGGSLRAVPRLNRPSSEQLFQSSGANQYEGSPKGAVDAHSRQNCPPPYREPPSPSSHCTPPLISPQSQGQNSPGIKNLPPYREPPSPSHGNNSKPMSSSSVPPNASGAARMPPTANGGNQNGYVNGHSFGASQKELAKYSSFNSSLTSQQESSSSLHSSIDNNETWMTKDNSLTNGDTSNQIVSQPKGGHIASSYSPNSHYQDLIKVVNSQREKLTSQQVELTQYDAEIMFWEGKAREQQKHMDLINKEISRLESVSNQHESQVMSLAHLEEEQEYTQQESIALKSEINNLRTELEKCDGEIEECKKRIRLLIEELHLTQHQMAQRQEEWEAREAAAMEEIDLLRKELELTRQETDATKDLSLSLDQEMKSLEGSLSDKKQQMERLVAAMKEANLQSLSIQPSEDLMEVHHRSGSTRRMIGSPRQLENAAPTSKNPHGVWV